MAPVAVDAWAPHVPLFDLDGYISGRVEDALNGLAQPPEGDAAASPSPPLIEDGASSWCTSPTWSVGALMSDLCGLAVALLTLFGVCAACPRKPTVISTLGRRPLAFLLLHIYLVPLFQLPLHGIQRAFVRHLGWIAPVFVVLAQLFCCLLILILSSVPLPKLAQLRRARDWASYKIEGYRYDGPFAKQTVRSFKSSSKGSRERLAAATEHSKLLDPSPV